MQTVDGQHRRVVRGDDVRRGQHTARAEEPAGGGMEGSAGRPAAGVVWGGRRVHMHEALGPLGDEAPCMGDGGDSVWHAWRGNTHACTSPCNEGSGCV